MTTGLGLCFDIIFFFYLRAPREIPQPHYLFLLEFERLIYSGLFKFRFYSTDHSSAGGHHINSLI